MLEDLLSRRDDFLVSRVGAVVGHKGGGTAVDVGDICHWVYSGEIDVEADAGTATVCTDGVGIAFAVVAEGPSCALGDQAVVGGCCCEGEGKQTQQSQSI